MAASDYAYHRVVSGDLILTRAVPTADNTPVAVQRSRKARPRNDDRLGWQVLYARVQA